MMRIKTVIFVFLLGLTGAIPAAAQDGPFAPRVYVNDRVISQYELDQRISFMTVLGLRENVEEVALNALIDERLQMTVAKQYNVKLTPKQVEAGMAEFAGRAQLSTEEFLTALAPAGVEAQGFRDFVTAGLIWREIVRAKFGPRASISEAEIDQAIAQIDKNTSVQILASEIVIPAPEGQLPVALATARRLKAQSRTPEDFAKAARENSSSSSAGRGGRLNWTPVGNLPPDVVPVLLALKPGQVSAPVKLEGSVALFLLHEIKAQEQDGPVTMSVDYAQFLLPNTTAADAEFARIRNEVDVCNDLNKVALGLPAEQLLRETKPMAQVPSDIGLELAKLDPGESSTALVRGGNRVFLMLCNRIPVLDVPPSREAVRAQLLNQRLAAYGAGYLADLRANAIIREP
ncbi:peptidylprolyl isomerase [Rhodobacter ferrooxidans]|uniref:Parvulin-like PPIase n=1 Tax=Rhodobacter ferrooxidans TaxID=371731 RepID=C8S3V8_9RHOB|nr:peptidylprolyl isomerase [Rhodobacter sp. SW2]EEW24327.1 SurA domain protein [Rhodobacter sp. SW2]